MGVLLESYAKTLLLLLEESSVPALLVPDVGVVSDDVKKANILNEYFFNNFNSSSTPSSCPGVDHAHLLNPSAFPEEFLCTEDQVLDLISTLDTKKASGADGISVRMIKATAPSIVCSLTKLFNLSLKFGKVPSDWKFARIVPIPKSGNPVNPSNYRPISILPVLNKLLEKHIHNIISYHLHNVCPLSPNQWGYILQENLLPLLFFLSRMNSKRLSTLEVRFVLFFSILVKPLTLFLTNHSSSNFSIYKSTHLF